jgi:hypothetical protein
MVSLRAPLLPCSIPLSHCEVEPRRRNTLCSRLGDVRSRSELYLMRRTLATVQAQNENPRTPVLRSWCMRTADLWPIELIRPCPNAACLGGLRVCGSLWRRLASGLARRAATHTHTHQAARALLHTPYRVITHTQPSPTLAPWRSLPSPRRCLQLGLPHNSRWHPWNPFGPPCG